MFAIESMERTALQAPTGGLRPFDLGRDLRAVADLIEEAFRLELDERGAAALREVRSMGRLGRLIRLLGLSSLEMDGFFGGFVWVEEGKVVGNITVQKGDKVGARWQIANVAVASAWRGRGISRRLMERAVQHVRECGGRWATLQVYESNTIARTLYEHLGFEVVGGLTDLEARTRPLLGNPPADLPALAPFYAAQWQSLYELANNQLGAAAQWWRPLRRSDFEQPLEAQVGEWLWGAVGRRHIYRRSVQQGQRFEAAAVLVAQRWSGAHRLQLLVRPEHYGRLEQGIVQWALHTLADYPALPVTASVPADHVAALEALCDAGLQPRRTLLTMRLDVAPEWPADAAGA